MSTQAEVRGQALLVRLPHQPILVASNVLSVDGAPHVYCFVQELDEDCDALIHASDAQSSLAYEGTVGRHDEVVCEWPQGPKATVIDMPEHS